MARGLYFSVGLLVAVMVAISAAQDVPMVMPVEAEPQPVVETVIPVVAEEPGVDGEQRPKRQFLAGLLIGSLIGHGHHHHHHGYGYGHGYGHGYHRTPYYGGGYRYGYPYYG